ncbi:MAG: glycosyltransferase [Candidatus Roizmanbacteria bacterium]|nr:MAG: glycosyltransferase [Candidatus Roizmanbacteria bacterium]
MKNKKVLFIIHRIYFNDQPKLGGVDRIIDFLKKNNETTTIEHPFEKINHPSVFTSKVKKLTHNSVLKPPLIWFEEFVFNVYWILKNKNVYDLAVASDPLNYFSCLILKLLKKVNKTQFHSTDYSPKRFNNLLLDIFYHFLYNLSVKNADIITVTSTRMHKVVQEKLDKVNIHKVFLLPNSPYFSFIPKTNINKKNPLDLVMLIGRWGDQINTENIINGLKLLKKDYPNIRLNIIGHTDNSYIKLFKENKLDKNIILYGSLPYDKAMEKMSNCYIGITSYSETNSYVHFADSLKIREYAAAGLPTVCDSVYGTSEEVIDYESGDVYNTSLEMYEKIKKLIKDFKLYKEKSDNAIKWAQRMDKQKLLNNLYEKYD